MKIRHRALWIGGLGAFLGLWSIGCTSSGSGNRQPQLFTSPPSVARGVAPQSPAPTGQAVTLLKPRAAAEHDTGLRPVSAVTLEPPPRTEVPPEQVPQENVASSWKPMPRGDVPVVTTVPLNPDPLPPGISTQEPSQAPPLASEASNAPEGEPEGLPPPMPGVPVNKVIEPEKQATPLPQPAQTTPQPTPVVQHAPIQVPQHHHGHGVPRELNKHPLPPYIIEPPDILRIQVPLPIPGIQQAIAGNHLVRPDGTVNLGIYGSVYVARMTMDEARRAVADKLFEYFRGSFDEAQEQSYLGSLGIAASKLRYDVAVENLRREVANPRQIDLDVVAYNSKVYYVIYDGAGFGEVVYRLPVTGNDTVLDAISQVFGLPSQATKHSKIWVARAHPGCRGNPQKLPVDWVAVTQCGSAASNYQLIPGDRIYVHADPLQCTDRVLSKVLSPIERLLGITLLGSSTVNSIKSGGNNNNNNN